MLSGHPTRQFLLAMLLAVASSLVVGGFAVAATPHTPDGTAEPAADRTAEPAADGTAVRVENPIPKVPGGKVARIDRTASAGSTVAVDPSPEGLGIVVLQPDGVPVTVARLRVDGLESRMWTGYGCRTGSGRFVAATFGPAEMLNKPELRDKGGFLAIVDLQEEAVRFVSERVALKYHTPGCGPTDEVTALRHHDQGASTELLEIDPTTAAVVRTAMLDGHHTNPIRVADTTFVSSGATVSVVRDDQAETIATTDGQTAELHATPEGALGFLVVDRTTGTAAAHRIPQRSDQRVDLTDPRTAPSALAEGSMADLQWVPDSAKTNRLEVLAESESASEPSVLPDPNVEQFRAGSLTLLANQTSPTCAVPRNDPEVMAPQPSPAQVEWAVHRAVRGDLTSTRPATTKYSAFQPQVEFPRTGLSGGGRVPAQILLGVLAQESNLWQASRGALPGVAGNPLVGDYYGVVIDGGGRIVDMDFDEADCGYGIGQVTDGMRLGSTTRTPTEQYMIAMDYQANIAASLVILEEKWNELLREGVIEAGTDPAVLENWYPALWAYNTGYNREPGREGLGWTNNPANSDYRFDRRYYLRESLDDARTPGNWSYPERVLGYAETGLWLGGTAPVFEPINGSLNLPTVRSRAIERGDPNAEDLPFTVSRFEFCTDHNDCSSTHFAPGGPRQGDRSFCRDSDRKCWWSNPSPLALSEGAGENAGPHNPGASEPTVARRYASVCDPTQSARPDWIPEATIGSAIVVDDINTAVNWNGCPTVQRAGTFSLTPSSPVAAIDVHQIAAGYGGHFYYTHTNWEARSSHRVTGTWTPPATTTGWHRILVHIPTVGADTYQADYRIYDGSEPSGGPSRFHRVVNQRWNEDRWIELGVFDLGAGARVELSNDTISDYGNGRNVDLAWDAVAFVPTGSAPAASYVALGDSYATGEGMGDYLANTDIKANSSNEENACHRSSVSYPVDVHGLLGTSGAATTFASVACSAATVGKLADQSAAGIVDGEVPQLAQGWLDENTTHATISIGIHDVPFMDALWLCIEERACDPATWDSSVANLAPADIRALQPSMEQVFGSLRTEAPNAQIAVVGYPRVDPLNLGPNCVDLLTPAGRQWVNAMADELESTLADAAAVAGIGYLTLDPVFPPERGCMPTDLLPTSLTDQDCVVCEGGERFRGSFHPDRIGHLRIADHILTRLESPECRGLSATIVAVHGQPTVGTPGDDVILGTDGDDVIDGSGGNDTICGRNGDDELIGGLGDDVLDGGIGSDQVDGGDGTDICEDVDQGLRDVSEYPGCERDCSGGLRAKVGLTVNVDVEFECRLLSDNFEVLYNPVDGSANVGNPSANPSGIQNLATCLEDGFAILGADYFPSAAGERPSVDQTSDRIRVSISDVYIGAPGISREHVIQFHKDVLTDGGSGCAPPIDDHLVYHEVVHQFQWIYADSLLAQVDQSFFESMADFAASAALAGTTPPTIADVCNNACKRNLGNIHEVPWSPAYRAELFFYWATIERAPGRPVLTELLEEYRDTGFSVSGKDRAVVASVLGNDAVVAYRAWTLLQLNVDPAVWGSTPFPGEDDGGTGQYQTLLCNTPGSTCPIFGSTHMVQVALNGGTGIRIETSPGPGDLQVGIVPCSGGTLVRQMGSATIDFDLTAEDRSCGHVYLAFALPGSFPMRVTVESF